MSSKRAKRKKRRDNFKIDNPTQVKPKEEVIVEEKPLKKLPGQNLVRTGSILLLVGALVSAVLVWWAIRNMKDMTAEEMIAITAANNQTPMGYTIGLALTSIAAVFQMTFGFQIFRNSNNPFFWKHIITMGIILAAVQLVINLVDLIMSRSAINLMSIIYGTIIPMVIVWGGVKYKKFAEDHPGYPVPEPVKMF